MTVGRVRHGEPRRVGRLGYSTQQMTSPCGSLASSLPKTRLIKGFLADGLACTEAGRYADGPCGDWNNKSKITRWYTQTHNEEYVLRGNSIELVVEHCDYASIMYPVVPWSVSLVVTRLIC